MMRGNLDVVASASVLEAFGLRAVSPHAMEAAAHRLAALHARRRAVSLAGAQAEEMDRTVLASLHMQREIDTCRAELVLDIDAWLHTALPARRVSVVHTETVGTVIDRMALLWSGTSGDEHATERRRRLGELADGLDDLLADLADGRRRQPGW